jgi:hypothetical protein
VLKTLIGDPSLRVTTGSVSLGWFSPLLIEDLRIRNPDGTVDIAARRLRAESSWFAMWLFAPELGPIEVQELQVEVVLGEDAQAEDASGRASELTSLPTFSVNLTDASLVVRESPEAEPVLDAQQIDVKLRTEQRPGGSVLIVDPIVLAKNEDLTQEACDHGIQLVAPELVDEVELEGSFSLELTKMQLALGSAETAADSDVSTIEGVVTLHHAAATLKNDVTRRLVLAAAELMELGEVPESIRLAENAELKFSFASGRVSHSGMVLLLPDDIPGLSIRTSGSVGMDESLDLAVELTIPLGLFNKTQLAVQLASTPLETRVTGTIDRPRLRIPDDQEWLSLIHKQLAPPDVAQADKELADKVLSLLADLNDESAARNDIDPP